MAQITIKDGNNANQTAALVPNTGATVAVSDSLPVVMRDASVAGAALSTTLIGGKNRLDVTLAAGVAPGTAVPSVVDVVAGSDGTNARAILTDASGRQIVTLAPHVTLTGPAAQTTGNNVLASDSATPTDALPYRSGVLEIVSTGTGGTWIVEQSINGTTWVPVVLYEASVISGAPINAAVTATATTRIFAFAIGASLLRVRVATTITGGSIQARATLSQVPFANPVLSVVQATAANLNATATLAAGTAAVGDVGTQYRANATGAASISQLVAAGTTNPTVVKNAAGRLLGWTLGNMSTAWRYVKLHNQATAPTAGTGVVMTIAIPPGGQVSLNLEGGIGFSAGIALTTVTGSATTDATAVTAGDIVGSLFFA